MKNRRGFTLVELLVTVSILGIVTGISIPIIRGLSSYLTNKKYTEYMDSLVYASKLYTDTYSEDLFGYSGRGCAYVDYAELDNYKLIKDIDISDLSCNTDYTLVKVVKYREKYFYKAYLGCGSKESGKNTKASIFKPETEPVTKESLCDTEIGTAMNVLVTPSKEVSGTKKRVNPMVIIESYSGVSPTIPPRIKYGYVKAEGFDPENFNVADIKYVDDMTSSVNFKVPSLKKQEAILAKSIDDPISIHSTNRLTTPNDQSGEFYLVLHIERLLDADDITWKKDGTELDNYIVSGPYVIDNEKPKLTNLKVTSTTTEYNNKKVSVKFNTSDNMTETKDLKICISEKACTDDDYTRTYKAAGDTLTFKGDYDGSTKKVYVGIRDKSGNTVNLTSDNYVLYKECTVTKLSDWKDTSTCTKKCGGGTKTQEAYKVDSNLNTKCSAKETRSVSCNTMGCCSKTTDTYGTWSGWSSCSKKCGSGKQTRTRTVTKKSAYDGTICSTTTETGSQACNTMSCCSKTSTSCGGWSGWGSCSKKCGGGTHKRTRTCKKKSVYDGSTCSSYKDSDSASCNTMGCCSRTTTSCNGWNKKGNCSKSCGGGTQKWTRTCYRKSYYTGSTCSSYSDSKTTSCNTRRCCSSTKKSSCGSWSRYSRCSGGSQHRTRSCKYVSTINGQSCGSKTEKSFRNCRG